jgi:hypothetical protein
MTQEELAEFEQFKQAREKKREEEMRKREKEVYRELVNNAVDSNFKELQEASSTLKKVKAKVLAEFDTLITQKSELFDVRNEQRSHSFTNDDMTMRITIGNYVTDNYRDTVNEGIALVREAISDLATDAKGKVLVNAVMKLLSRDSQGNIKASRVMQLASIASKIENEKFARGVQIIQDAYAPSVSKRYIRCEYRPSTDSEWVTVPLGMTEAE